MFPGQEIFSKHSIQKSNFILMYNFTHTQKYVHGLIKWNMESTFYLNNSVVTVLIIFCLVPPTTIDRIYEGEHNILTKC